jgi:phage terminase large subunit-like protein
MRDQLVLFPHADHDDYFDALDHAISVIKIRERTPREEPGLL